MARSKIDPAPRITWPFNDLTQPEEEPMFQDYQHEYDIERWRGRGMMAELPEGGKHGAGGNADGSGDPIDTYHAKHRGDVLITGPEGVTGKGSKPRR